MSKSLIYTTPQSEVEDERFESYEALIPKKYQDMDDQKFEKFNKRNDWN